MMKHETKIVKQKMIKPSGISLSMLFVLCSFLLALAVLPAHAVSIDNPAVAPSSLDSNGQPVLPFVISYGLSTDSYFSLDIQNANAVIVRHLVENQLQTSEAISTHTITWNGLTDAGLPAPVGVYTFVFNAIDASNSSPAPTQNVSFSLTTAAKSGTADPKQIFENNAYIFPNPVRGGRAKFNYAAARDNATITLKVYTLSGDLVLEQTLATGATAGTVAQWPAGQFWDVTNQSGKGLGRGLYYCVFREQDPQGTLQVVKKMAVIR